MFEKIHYNSLRCAGVTFRRAGVAAFSRAGVAALRRAGVTVAGVTVAGVSTRADRYCVSFVKETRCGGLAARKIHCRAAGRIPTRTDGERLAIQAERHALRHDLRIAALHSHLVGVVAIARRTPRTAFLFRSGAFLFRCGAVVAFGAKRAGSFSPPSTIPTVVSATLMLTDHMIAFRVGAPQNSAKRAVLDLLLLSTQPSAPLRQASLLGRRPRVIGIPLKRFCFFIT